MSSNNCGRIPFILGFGSRSRSDLDFFGNANEGILRNFGLCRAEAQDPGKFVAWVQGFLKKGAGLPRDAVAKISYFLDEGISARAQDCCGWFSHKVLPRAQLPCDAVANVFEYLVGDIIISSAGDRSYVRALREAMMRGGKVVYPPRFIEFPCWYRLPRPLCELQPSCVRACAVYFWGDVSNSLDLASRLLRYNRFQQVSEIIQWIGVDVDLSPWHWWRQYGIPERVPSGDPRGDDYVRRVDIYGCRNTTDSCAHCGVDITVMGEDSLEDVGVNGNGDDVLLSCFSCYHQLMVGFVCRVCGVYHIDPRVCGVYHIDPVDNGCPFHFSAEERFECMVCHRSGAELHAHYYRRGLSSDFKELFELLVVCDACEAVDDVAHYCHYYDYCEYPSYEFTPYDLEYAELEKDYFEDLDEEMDCESSVDSFWSVGDVTEE